MPKNKNHNPHMGSTLDSLLEEEGVRVDYETHATKEVIAWQIEQAMESLALSKAGMAKRMGTSRSQLDRLLSPGQDVMLSTLARAASVVGKSIRVELV